MFIKRIRSNIIRIIFLHFSQFLALHKSEYTVYGYEHDDFGWQERLSHNDVST